MPSLFTTFLLLPAFLRSVSFAQNSSSTACNNSPDLCDLPYNNVTYLGAHDSPFLRDSTTDYSESGNQFYNSTVQLSAGVRLLTAQVHSANSSSGTAEWHLCHSSCSLLDAGTLSNWLSEIKSWLDSNPNEVVTILLVNSDDASAEDLAAEYSAADIVSYVYTPPSTTTAPDEWPTLQTLINNGTRLLNFVASLDASSNSSTSYLMDEFTFIYENAYDVTSPSNFSCTVSRPSSGATDTMMPLMNHFLYAEEAFGIEYPNVTYIETTNAESGGTGNLGDAATECTSEYGRAPTYLLVDFFNVGPAIATVDSLNNVTNPVGRTNVSEEVLTSTSSTTSGAAVPSIAGVSVLLTLAVMLLGL